MSKSSNENNPDIICPYCNEMDMNKFNNVFHQFKPEDRDEPVKAKCFDSKCGKDYYYFKYRTKGVPSSTIFPKTYHMSITEEVYKNAFGNTSAE